MTKPNDGGPAFPVPGNPETMPGMTLRDRFAGQALAGLIASNDDGSGDRIEAIPPYAYQIADAMLAAREATR